MTEKLSADDMFAACEVWRKISDDLSDRGGIEMHPYDFDDDAWEDIAKSQSTYIAEAVAAARQEGAETEREECLAITKAAIRNHLEEFNELGRDVGAKSISMAAKHEAEHIKLMIELRHQD